MSDKDADGGAHPNPGSKAGLVTHLAGSHTVKLVARADAAKKDDGGGATRRVEIRGRSPAARLPAPGDKPSADGRASPAGGAASLSPAGPAQEDGGKGRPRRNRGRRGKGKKGPDGEALSGY